MSKMIRAVQPILAVRDEWPNESARAACVDVDHLIQAWHQQLGIPDPVSDDE